MKDLYASLRDLSEKKRLYATLGVLTVVLCLLAILLLFFLHPRGLTYLFFGISLGILLIGIFFVYYFLFYKLGHLKAVSSFLGKAKKEEGREPFLFLKEEGSNYAKNLGYRKLSFLNKEGKEKTFLLLLEIPCPFKEGKEYALSFYEDCLIGYEEKQDEGEE